MKFWDTHKVWIPYRDKCDQWDVAETPVHTEHWRHDLSHSDLVQCTLGRDVGEHWRPLERVKGTTVDEGKWQSTFTGPFPVVERNPPSVDPTRSWPKTEEEREENRSVPMEPLFSLQGICVSQSLSSVFHLFAHLKKRVLRFLNGPKSQRVSRRSRLPGLTGPWPPCSLSPRPPLVPSLVLSRGRDRPGEQAKWRSARVDAEATWSTNLYAHGHPTPTKHQ